MRIIRFASSTRGGQGHASHDQRAARKRAPVQRFPDECPGECRHDQEGQAHEGIGQVQRRVAQHPDPAQGGEAVEGQRGDQPAVGQQRHQGKGFRQGGGGFFEQQLADGNTEYAEQGVEAEGKGHVGWCSAGDRSSMNSRRSVDLPAANSAMAFPAVCSSDTCSNKATAVCCAPRKQLTKVLCQGCRWIGRWT